MSSEGTNLHTMWFMFQDAAKETLHAGTQIVSSDMNLSADARPQVVPGDMNLSSESSTAVKTADLTLMCDSHTQMDIRYITTSEKSVEVITKCSYFDMLLLQDNISVSS